MYGGLKKENSAYRYVHCKDLSSLEKADVQKLTLQ